MSKKKNQQNQQRQSLSGQGQGFEEELRPPLSDGKKFLLTLLILIPSTFLFFYATGMWEVQVLQDGRIVRDSLDEIAVAMSICFGLFGIIIVNTFL